jgi:cytochrome b6-f complex iron-sulfur subunit
MSATVKLVTKVWIAPGCIVCDACETTAPTVFEVKHDDGTCIIRPAALEAEFCKPLTPDIIQASAECPVDVIKYETIEVPADQAPKFVASVAEAPKAGAAHDKAAPHAPAAAAEPAAAPATAKAAPEKPAKPAERPKSTDPAIAALLEAATIRGGAAGIIKGATAPPAVKELQRVSPDKLPPDARYARVIEKSKPEKAGEPTRREILSAGVAWAVMGVGVGLPSLMGFARFMMPNVLEEPEPKVRCGPLADFMNLQPGDVDEKFKISGKFWVIREEERLAALSIICTHLGCIPSWLPNDRKFKCPCHGSGFKPNGTNFEGPAPRPLERFKIYLDGGNVVVDRSRKFIALGPNDVGVWNDPEASIPV